MLELVEFPNNRWEVRQGNYYHSKSTRRWYKEIDKIQDYCLMEKDQAETILMLLQRKSK